MVDDDSQVRDRRTREATEELSQARKAEGDRIYRKRPQLSEDPTFLHQAVVYTVISHQNEGAVSDTHVQNQIEAFDQEYWHQSAPRFPEQEFRARSLPP